MLGVCILTIAKNEDQYIDEWINWHLNIGVDHIFILDNNDFDNRLIIENTKCTVIPYNDIEWWHDNGWKTI